MTFDKMEFEGIQVFNSCSWSNDYKIRGQTVLLLKSLRRETALGKKLVFTQQRATGTILKEKQANKGYFTLPFGEDVRNVGVRKPNPSSTEEVLFPCSTEEFGGDKGMRGQEALLPVELQQQLQADSEGSPQSPVQGHQGKDRDIPDC